MCDQLEIAMREAMDELLAHSDEELLSIANNPENEGFFYFTHKFSGNPHSLVDWGQHVGNEYW